jgi:hypothetical protein
MNTKRYQEFKVARQGDDDDIYLRLQHGIGFDNLVHKSYVKHTNPSNKSIRSSR